MVLWGPWALGIPEPSAFYQNKNSALYSELIFKVTDVSKNYFYFFIFDMMFDINSLLNHIFRLRQFVKCSAVFY